MNQNTRSQCDLVERQLLGGMLRNGRAAAEECGGLLESDFRHDAHRRVYRAMQSLLGKNAPVDVVGVASELQALGLLGDLGGSAGEAMAFLVGLTDDEPTAISANVAYYARQVRGLAIKRRLVEAGREVIQAGEDPSLSVEDAIDRAERAVYAVGEERLSLADDVRHVREIVGEMYDAIDQRERGETVCGVSTGLGCLDLLLAGLRPSELIIVAARPGVGKTTFGLTLAAHAAIHEGVPVTFVTLEQPARELIERMTCAVSGVDSQAIKQARMSADERNRLTEAGDRIRSAMAWVSDLPNQRVSRIAAMARRKKSRGELGLLVIDYLQLIEPEDRRAQRHEQVGQISRRLKLLARELAVPVVVMAQVNRSSENRAEQRPRLADLRESGSIEADADVVILLHKDKQSPDALELNVAKNRSGPTGDLVLRYDAKTGRVSDTPAGGW